MQDQWQSIGCLVRLPVFAGCHLLLHLHMEEGGSVGVRVTRCQKTSKSRRWVSNGECKGWGREGWLRAIVKSCSAPETRSLKQGKEQWTYSFFLLLVSAVTPVSAPWGDQKDKQRRVGGQTTEEKSTDSNPADPEKAMYYDNLKHPIFYAQTTCFVDSLFVMVLLAPSDWEMPRRLGKHTPKCTYESISRDA